MLSTILFLLASATASPNIYIVVNVKGKQVHLETPYIRTKASNHIKQHIETGCGPLFIGTKSLNSIMGLPVTEACNIHDWQYTLGKTDEERKVADDTLLKNMRRIANSRRDVWHPFRLIGVDIYYTVVRAFGWAFFGECHNKECEKIKQEIALLEKEEVVVRLQ